MVDRGHLTKAGIWQQSVLVSWQMQNYPNSLDCVGFTHIKHLSVCVTAQTQESWVKSASAEQHLTLDCSWCLPANPATPHQSSRSSPVLSLVHPQPHFCCRCASGQKWRSGESVTTHIGAQVPSNKLGPPGFCSLIRIIHPNAVNFTPGHPI